MSEQAARIIDEILSEPVPMPRKVGPRGGASTFTSSGSLYRATIYVDLECWTRLKQEALDTGKTAAQIVRDLIEERYR